MLVNTQWLSCGNKSASYTPCLRNLKRQLAVLAVCFVTICPSAVAADLSMRVRESFTGQKNAAERGFQSEVIQLLLEKKPSQVRRLPH
jgi:hypothetical protein